MVAIALGDRTARVLRIDTQTELAVLWHNSPVNSVNFSPDAKQLATGSSDLTARVWEINNSSEVARIIDRNVPLIDRNDKRNEIKLVLFSPKGKYVTTAFGSIEGYYCNYVRHWLWRPEDRSGDLCSRLTKGLDSEELKKYLRNEKQKSCPNIEKFDN